MYLCNRFLGICPPSLPPGNVAQVSQKALIGEPVPLPISPLVGPAVSQIPNFFLWSVAHLTLSLPDKARHTWTVYVALN